MIITMHEGYDSTYMILTSKHEEFRKIYGDKVIVRTNMIYHELDAITRWCNNIVGEECLFEID